MNKDLTVGKPQTVLWKFCLPLFGSIIFQQLYNIGDSFVAGKFISEEALASVGNGYEITLIFIAFAFGCNVGCSVLASRLFGAKEYSRMKSAIYTSFISTLLTCVFLMLIGLIGMDTILKLIKTPENIYKDSALYLDIYIYGLPFLFLYNLSTGIFSALGDSKTPFYFLAFSSTANIAVDILFVTVFNMGVAGVAWATFICQGFSAILAVIVVLKRMKNTPDNKNVKLFDTSLFKEFISLAIPSTIQQSFVSIGNIFVQGMINGFGSSVVAGYSASIKLNNLVISSFSTIGSGLSNYTAQNIGAGKEDRVIEGWKAGLRIVWTISIPFILLYFGLPNLLLKLFMENPSEGALKSGREILRILSPFYVIICCKMISDGVLKGAGKMNYFMISTFTDLILRVLIAFLLSKTMLGATGIWLSWPLGWVMGSVLSVSFVKTGCWKDKRIKLH